LIYLWRNEIKNYSYNKNIKDMANNNLNSLRQEIDALDAKILGLLAQRMKLVFKVGVYKKQQGIVPLDQTRWQKILKSKLLLAQKLGLDKDMIKDIYERIHESALKLESKVQKGIKL
jgi:chorismate mutase